MLIAGGIAMQVWRAQSTQAAEQKSGDASGTARMDAQTTAFARVNSEPISYEALAKECVERYGKEVLENMISRTIIQQACAERSVVGFRKLKSLSRSLRFPKNSVWPLISTTNCWKPNADFHPCNTIAILSGRCWHCENWRAKK